MAGKETDCKDCLPPLLEENSDAVSIYFIVQGQVIVGGMSGTIIDLKHSAIYGAMDLYEVEKKRKCFEKVRKIFAHFQKEREEGNSPEDIIKEYSHTPKKQQPMGS